MDLKEKRMCFVSENYFRNSYYHNLTYEYLNSLPCSLTLNTHLFTSWNLPKFVFPACHLRFSFLEEDVVWGREHPAVCCSVFSSHASRALKPQCSVCTPKPEICKHWNVEGRMWRKRVQPIPCCPHPPLPLQVEQKVWAAKAPITLLLADTLKVQPCWWLKVENKKGISYYCFLGMEFFLSL